MSETTELHGGILLTSFGQQVLFVDKARYVATMKKLVDDGLHGASANADSIEITYAAKGAGPTTTTIR